jgi:Cd2+/Zn2+-exporting ATPase
MLAVALGSASIGAWGEGATLLFLFSLSGALEHYALGRTQREIESLFKATPKTALVLDAAGNEVETPVSALTPGTVLAVKPDSQFPVDGVMTSGTTAADESNLSGESAPVDKRRGDLVLAGTMNLWGAVRVEVSRPAAESALQRIIHLIRQAQQSKAPSQRFTDRFGSGYTAVVLTLTVVMFFFWWRMSGLPPLVSTEASASAFYRAMTLLVVASPCALVLSIPSAILAAIAWAARRGILFRGGAAVEQLAEVNVVALDKTGTLTTGELAVESLDTWPAGREAEVQRFAFALASHSTHPLSRALTAHGRRLGWQRLEVDHLESVPGQGVSGWIAGRLCLLGRHEFIASLATSAAQALLPDLPPQKIDHLGQPGVWFATDDVVGCIRFRDRLRAESPQLIESLRNAGLHTVLLTGDRRENAAALHRDLPLDEVRSELRPEDKLNYIARQIDSGRRVAMVGDGVNDAPSLAAAHVGVAMGARGSDAALEQADVVLMRDRLENFLAAFRLSQRARRIIQQNLFISLGTVIVLVGFALAGQIPLTLGVIGHEGSTVVVVLNSLRLLFASGQQPAGRATG